jgi:hypothetical protein
MYVWRLRLNTEYKNKCFSNFSYFQLANGKYRTFRKDKGKTKLSLVIRLE